MTENSANENKGSLPYTQDNLSGLYSLARMYFTSGFHNEAEKISLALLALNDRVTPARLLLAGIQFEKGNYSLAANHYRISAQIETFSLIAKLGLLACYSGLRDYSRAAMLAEELEREISSFTSEERIFFQLYKSSILANT